MKISKLFGLAIMVVYVYLSSAHNQINAIQLDTSSISHKAPWAGSTDNMVLIPAGSFLMGWQPIENVDWPADETADDEVPVHDVYLDSFYIDKYEVTNRQFKEFVDSTGYITSAEEKGESVVIDTTINPDGGWGYGWTLKEGAYWKAPQGPGSSITDKMDHPVVHVSWEDAKAFAAWAGKRLPTEAEWEKSARGKLEQKIFTWGLDYSEIGLYSDFGLYMNWHGDIREDVVYRGDMLDGYAYTTSPVGSFPENGYGLFDMAGNVFEYVNDWYDENYYSNTPANNPQGPVTGGDKIIRGGSWRWCECYARPASRDPVPTEYSDDCTGFRLALSVYTTSVGFTEETVTNPSSYSLDQNYPNPFNPTTTIRYSIPRTSRVTLIVYNLLGQEVKALINETQTPGNKWITWDGRDNHGEMVNSGIYFYGLKIQENLQLRKMLLIK
jgi:formylglycine-generating enzyme required for sulfatase activity